MSKLKIAGISLISLFLIFSIAVVSWFTYIKVFAPDKKVSHTFEVGLQETVTGETKYFMEINSYDDCFEVKFNYMLDENKTALYSQGVQFFGSDITFELSHANFHRAYVDKLSGNLWWTDCLYNQYTKYYLSSGESYYYMLEDDSKPAMNSTNPISVDSFFKIDLDGEIYGMELKGDETPKDYDENFAYSYSYDRNSMGGRNLVDTYYYYNMDYLLQRVYMAVDSLPYGTNDARVFEFADIFNYYEYKDDGNYIKIDSLDKAETIEAEVKSFYSILVKKHKGNIQKASDSLFNVVAGSSNYNITEVESEDYFYGRTTITVDNAEDASEFSLVKITDTEVALKLNDGFNAAYLPYAEKIELIVLVDLDVLTSQGLEFVGFTADSGLENYTILSCQTVQTIDGELVYSGVAYD